MKIIQCGNTESQAWNTFLDSQGCSSFYHLFGWKTIVETCLGHTTYFLAATEGDIFLGVLPLVYINSRLFGKILCSMPFLNFGGICAVDAGIEAALLDEARHLVDHKKMAYLELRNTQKLHEPLPTSQQKVSMTLTLDSDPDNIWAGFKSKQRKTIRRAYKNNLHVKNGGEELLDHFYTILAKSWRALGTPIYARNFFQNILKTFPDNTRIFMIYHEDKPIAGAFNGYFRDVIEGMWLGVDYSYRSLQPNYILYWEMIKHGCENGYKHFHLGRSSKDSGGEHFKKKWNAETTQLYWQYYLGSVKAIPQLNVHNSKYQLAIRLWKKLPLQMTICLGPQIARSIP